MLQTELLETFNKLPEPLQKEVLHYAEFLAEKCIKDSPENGQTTEGKPGKRGIFGIWKGKIKMADDFDEPLEEFKEYME